MTAVVARKLAEYVLQLLDDKPVMLNMTRHTVVCAECGKLIPSGTPYKDLPEGPMHWSCRRVL